MPPSLMLTPSTGEAVMGVVSELLKPPALSAVTLAELLSSVTPTASGLSTSTAKSIITWEPPPNVPILKSQAEPGVVFAQLQPAVLTPLLKLLLSGTVSCSTRLAVSWLPVLDTVSV